jgi:hypothetical protein
MLCCAVQIAVDLPKPHTPATVAEWAQEMYPEFLKQEQEQRMAAEKIAAEKEAKRLVARNLAKVGNPVAFLWCKCSQI